MIIITSHKVLPRIDQNKTVILDNIENSGLNCNKFQLQ